VIRGRLWSNCSKERRRFVSDLVESLLYGKERKSTIGFWRTHKITIQHRFNMSNFDPNAILRGAQLTFVGGEVVVMNISRIKIWRLSSANRALLNPQVFKHAHYRQAALAVLAGILIRLIMEVPVRLLSYPITHTCHWYLIRSSSPKARSGLQVSSFNLNRGLWISMC